MIISKGRHTESSPFNLFSRKSKDRDYFNHYLENNLSHRGSGLNLGINVEPSEEVFHAFEDVDQGIVTCLHVLGRLAVPNVTRKWEEIKRELRTDRRISILQKTAFAGGNTLVYS